MWPDKDLKCNIRGREFGFGAEEDSCFSHRLARSFDDGRWGLKHLSDGVDESKEICHFPV